METDFSTMLSYQWHRGWRDTETPCSCGNKTNPCLPCRFPVDSLVIITTTGLVAYVVKSTVREVVVTLIDSWPDVYEISQTFDLTNFTQIIPTDKYLASLVDEPNNLNEALAKQMSYPELKTKGGKQITIFDVMAKALKKTKTDQELHKLMEVLNEKTNPSV